MALIWLVACTGEPEDSGKDTDSGAEPTDDSGTTTPDPVWTTYNLGTSSTLQGVYASGQGVYVVGTGGKAWVPGDTDDTWTSDDPSVEGNDLTDLWGQGAGDSIELWATGHNGYIAHYTGGNWAADNGPDDAQRTSNFEGIGGTADHLYAVSWGSVYLWDGVSWTFKEAPAELNDVWASGDQVFAVGERGAIFTLIGEEWSSVDSGTEADLNAIDGTAGDLWVAGVDGTVLHFDGVAFTPVDVGTDAALWSVFAPEPDAVYVAGSNGVAKFWDGTVWTDLPTGVNNNIYAMNGVNADNVWAVGNRGLLMQYKVD